MSYFNYSVINKNADGSDATDSNHHHHKLDRIISTISTHCMYKNVFYRQPNLGTYGAGEAGARAGAGMGAGAAGGAGAGAGVAVAAAAGGA